MDVGVGWACADNKHGREGDRVKRDYALGQIGYPRVS
jgi:hypothetical protein